MDRPLFLASYDVRHPARLRRALAVLKEFATGGQYSAFECYLTTAERQELLARVRQELEPEDCFLLILLQRSPTPHLLGAALPPQDGQFYLVS